MRSETKREDSCVAPGEQQGGSNLESSMSHPKTEGQQLQHQPANRRRKMEDFLVVPKRFTKQAYDLLNTTNATCKAWHLQGRYGSRTCCISEEEGTMGLPIPSGDILRQRAQEYPELQHLLDQEGVSIESLPFQEPRPHRSRDLPYVDGRVNAHLANPADESGEWLKHASFPPNERSYAFTFAELFAGIGGFGVALEALHGKCIFCSELEPICRKIYQDNLSVAADALHGDIYKVPDKAFPPPGTCDLLVAGFPCQPFSALGLQPGLSDAKGVLFLEIVRFLKVSRPKAFLLENVPGLLQMKDTFETILSAMEDCGYKVEYQVCWARGLTPTTRKRLFFAGVLQSDDKDTAKECFQFPFIPDLELRAVDVIDYDLKDDWMVSVLTLSDKTLHQLLTGHRFRPSGLAWPNVTCDTMTSHYGNSVGRGDSQLVPQAFPRSAPRRLTPRECARLMGFPNAFVFPNRPRKEELQGDMAYMKELYRMFGNAVCPPVIAAIAGALLEHCGSLSNGRLVGRRMAISLAYEATIIIDDDDKPSFSNSNLSLCNCPPDFFHGLSERFRFRTEWLRTHGRNDTTPNAS